MYTKQDKFNISCKYESIFFNFGDFISIEFNLFIWNIN